MLIGGKYINNSITKNSLLTYTTLYPSLKEGSRQFIFRTLINILVIFLLVILFACKKDKMELNETFDTTGATLISSGTFVSNGHPTSGNVKLYSKNNTNTLVFENLMSESGPDLRVFLSKATDNNDYHELGSLKATSGNFYYTVDTAINTSEYKYVLIWCEDFSVLFGNTELK